MVKPILCSSLDDKYLKIVHVQAVVLMDILKKIVLQLIAMQGYLLLLSASVTILQVAKEEK